MKNVIFRRWTRYNVRRVVLLIAGIAVFTGVGSFIFDEPAKASNPPTGSIGVNGASVTWVGTATGPGGGLPQNEAVTCQEGVNCDIFTLTVTGTQADWATAGGRINVLFTWSNPGIDYDMIVRKESGAQAGYQASGANADPIVNTSGGSTTIEQVVISPGDLGVGTYYVRAYYFAGGGPQEQYNGSAAYFTVPTGLPPSGCALPTYDNYQPPAGMSNRDNAGEPTVGANWNTGNILTQARLYSYRATFNDSTSPSDPTNPVSGVSWLAKRTPLTVTGLDPLIVTDPVTGRTFGGELNADGHEVGGISDDDLNTFTQAVFGGGVTQGVDHQGIGVGPPKPGIVGRQPVTSYPHLVYYASQQIGYASIATSFDGGFTWGQDIPMWSLVQCGGLHGHPQVAPDGTVYVPNRNCSGKAAVAVSDNNGLSWSIRIIPSSSSESDDPTIGIGAGGRLYVGYTAADKRPHVVVSDDKGLTWRDDYDLSAGIPGGIRASVFPSTVAGDNNRAAVFFLATNSPDPDDPTGTDGEDSTPGNTTDDFAGTWYPYIATTCDGGKSWSVVKADHDPLRPGLKNPVQQGVVCKSGTTCPGPPVVPVDTRNLLDFNDITVDARGRIVASYADGCITSTCIALADHSSTRNGNDGTATLTLIRQRGGMRLFGAFDTNGPAPPPLAPPVWIEEGKQANLLKWSIPDDGGSPLTSYRIYRGIAGQGETLIAEVKSRVLSYTDRLKQRNSNFYYRVAAVNAYGESPNNMKFFPAAKSE